MGGENEFECELTKWHTVYSMYARDDYKRCVCESWGVPHRDCMMEGDETGGGGDGGDGGEDNGGNDGGDNGGNDGGDNGGNDGGSGGDSSLADLMALLTGAKNHPNYSEDEKSRTQYQVDQSLEYIEIKLKEFYQIMETEDLLLQN